LRAEVNIDTQEIVKEIAQEVVKAIRPLLVKNNTIDDTLFSVETLSKYLSVSTQWVYERVHMKEIPFIKMGKFPRFRKSDIEKWLDAQKIPSINTLSRRLKVIK